MKKIKIVVIGGGSSYTPELMEGFIRRYTQLPISEIWLVDIIEGKEKLNIIYELSLRMWKSYDIKLYQTLDRIEALKDADVVITQLRVGQLKARIIDERIPLSYGMIGQETNGAGGILKAFRTIPVILEIVEEMKKYCPYAWLINFTNPSGMITEAVIRYGKWEKVLGLCNIPVNNCRNESHLLNQKQEDLIFQYGGLNHFHWHIVLNKNKENISQQVLEKMSNEELPANIFKIDLFKEQLLHMNMIPCSYHVYYYRQEESLKHMLEEYHTIGTRGQQVLETEKVLFNYYQEYQIPEILSKRGGAYYSDTACEIISSIQNNTQATCVVSTLNKKALKDLPDDCVVEVSAQIGKSGATPLPFPTLHPSQAGWLQLMKNMELCVCEAAISGNYGLALEAFFMNPLIPSGNSAKQVLDELLVAHKKYLPLFSSSIKKIQEKGIIIQDEIVLKMID